MEKRFLKLFCGKDFQSVIDKINAFSNSQPVKILNYETLNSIYGDVQILVFYTKFDD